MKTNTLLLSLAAACRLRALQPQTQIVRGPYLAEPYHAVHQNQVAYGCTHHIQRNGGPAGRETLRSHYGDSTLTTDHTVR